MPECREPGSTDDTLLLQSLHDIRDPAGSQDIFHRQHPARKIALSADPTVKIKNIEALTTEPLLASLDGALDAALEILEIPLAEVDFGADQRLCADTLQYRTKIGLRVSTSIGGGGVEDIDACGNGRLDDAALLFMSPAHHQARGPAASKADLRYLDRATPEGIQTHHDAITLNLRATRNDHMRPSCDSALQEALDLDLRLLERVPFANPAVECLALSADNTRRLSESDLGGAPASLERQAFTTNKLGNESTRLHRCARHHDATTRGGHLHRARRIARGCLRDDDDDIVEIAGGTLGGLASNRHSQGLGGAYGIDASRR